MFLRIHQERRNERDGGDSIGEAEQDQDDRQCGKLAKGPFG